MLLSALVVSTLLAVLAFSSPVPDTDIQLLPRDGIKDCDDSSKLYSGPYTDGQGTYATSDRITHPYVFPAIRKCWYDYFVVSTETYLGPWKSSSGLHYCAGGASCSVATLTGTQACQSRSTSLSASVGFAIEDVTLGLDYTVTLDNSQCYTASDTSACIWTDDGCHVVWTQQQFVKQQGYSRQQCNYGDGDQTQCMGSWEIDTPTTYTNYGCNSKCTDTNTCGNTNGVNC